MLIVSVVAACFAALSAALAFLTWRTASASSEGRDVDLASKLDAVQAAVSGVSATVRDEQERARLAQSTELSVVRGELSAALENQQRALLQGLAELTGSLATAQNAALEALRTSQSNELAAVRSQVQDSLQKAHEGLVASVRQMQVAVEEHLKQAAESGRRNATEVAESVREARKEQTTALQQAQRQQDERMTALTAAMTDAQAAARRDVTDAVARLSEANEKKLEQMRSTVQEKLDATLGERLDASFKQVSQRLESVHKGLGEMQVLAQGVGSLQRTLTNVKTRGAWAELQLEALLVDLLTADQYERQVRVNPGSAELADFAISMPGAEDNERVRLAIDSKFPMDVYERFLSAWDSADAEEIKAASKALVTRIRAEAASIGRKYVNPPHTTDFAVMYLPTEALFAEVVRQPGLIHEIRTAHKVVLAGPTTLTALLGSLAMGFRTLAIQKRSSEAWQVLGQVKAEFEKSGKVWEKMVKQLETASNTAREAGVRHRAIEKSLTAVETTPLAAPLSGVPPLSEAAKPAELVPQQLPHLGDDDRAA